MAKERSTAQSTEEQFESIALRTDDNYDPGLIMFHKAMRRAEGQLQRDPYDDASAHGLLDDLNGAWPYHAQPVTLSGKLYLGTDEETFDFEQIPESWGERKLDSWGVYYDVDDVELYSLGIVDASSDGDPSKGATFAYAYGFDIDDEDTVLTLREQDIRQIEYPYCTREAAEARLRLLYPEIYTYVNKLVRPHTYDFNRLSSVLIDLVDKFPDVCTNGALGMWVSMYINTRVKFDNQHTYGFVVEGPMSVADADGMQDVFEIAEPFGFDASIVTIGFGQEKVKEGMKNHAYYAVYFPTGIKDKQEGISAPGIIPVQSVVSLYSRRPELSVGEQLRAARLEALRPSIIAAANVLYVFDNEEAPNTSDVDETNEERSAAMTRHESWNDLQQRFDASIAAAIELQKLVFRTPDEAMEAANKCTKSLWGILSQHPQFKSTNFYLSGEGVQLPQIKSHLKTSDEKTMYMVEIDNELRPAHRSQEVIGSFGGLVSSVDELDEEAYRPRVYALFGYRQEAEPTVLLAQYGTALSTTHLAQGCVVRLDGSAHVTVVGLRNEQEREYALKALSLARGIRKDQQRIARFNAAIHAENLKNLVSLRSVKLLYDIGRSIAESVHGDLVADALSAILRNKGLMISGLLIDLDGDVFDVNYVRGRTIDVVDRIPGSNEKRPSLVFRVADESKHEQSVDDRDVIHFLPLDTIREFRY